MTATALDAGDPRQVATWGDLPDRGPIDAPAAEVAARAAADPQPYDTPEGDVGAMRAIGRLGMRARDSNGRPVGIATRREDLGNRLVIDAAADGLQNVFEATVEPTKMARACGHDGLSGVERRGLMAKQGIADLTGVEHASVGCEDRDDGGPEP